MAILPNCLHAQILILKAGVHKPAFCMCMLYHFSSTSEGIRSATARLLQSRGLHEVQSPVILKILNCSGPSPSVLSTPSSPLITAQNPSPPPPSPPPSPPPPAPPKTTLSSLADQVLNSALAPVQAPALAPPPPRLSPPPPSIIATPLPSRPLTSPKVTSAPLGDLDTNVTQA